MKTILKYSLGFILTSLFIVFVINMIVKNTSKNLIYSDVEKIPKCYTGIVLGAFVHPSGIPSDFLQDRLDRAIVLYKSNKINRFLLSGDHGQKDYDEVNSMKNYLVKHGINPTDIFLDHAGFDTYNSMYRAKEIFNVKDVIIISQEFHLPRAIYIAKNMGLNPYGYTADIRNYPSINYLFKREILANIKAFLEVITNQKPKFLGTKIPIDGESDLSFD